MSKPLEKFWQASLHDIKLGYSHDVTEGIFTCLICGETFIDGMIYQDDKKLYEAKKYIEIHIANQHKSVFHALIETDKKLTGLTDHLKTILELFYAGESDAAIAKEIGANSTSTIRNHRFSLREKQKQAKLFLAIMELLEEKAARKSTIIATPKPIDPKNNDNRCDITEIENEKILAASFKYGLDGPLESLPQKEKKRIVIIRYIARQFEIDKQYTEKEVNAILLRFYDDYAILRRYLIEYGFMDRNADGSAYWLKS